ncbi:MAG TPA: hypothetical protein VHM89_01035 [Acidimicrobiales bacterium]|nr:hypothetical protein [Acidimicrobiales bacterium]
MWITVATPPFTSIDQVDAVLAQLPAAPEGMEARYVGTTADGELRIVSLWKSRDHADRFFVDTLGPVLAKVLAPEPVGISQALGIEVARRYESQPVG